MAHTPGPWREYLGKNYQVIGKNNYCVFLVGDTERVIPNPDDAALITAAPDLLEACKFALEWLQEVKDRNNLHCKEWGMMTLENAIAKAEGR